MYSRGRVFRLGALLCVLMLSAFPATRAQHGGGPPGGGGAGGGGGPEGNFGGGSGFGPNYGHMGPSFHPGEGMGGLHGGLQLGPPGRWWDDKHFAKDLKLRPDQQKRMDSIFEANRGTLTRHLGDVQQEEMRLQTLVHSKAPDEAAIDQQIERKGQARAELEKALAHMLLQLRGEMDADQLTKLEDLR